MGRGILTQRKLSGGVAAMFVVLCMIAAVFVPAVPSRAEPYDVTDDPVMSVFGETSDANAGRSVAFLDINGDGIGDLVVGAPGDSDAGTSSGKVMIYLGGAVKSDPDVVITGSAGERFGYSVARAGHVNSDEIDDLIVGAPKNDTGATDVGAAYIIFGSEDLGDLPEKAHEADVIFTGDAASGQLGYSVSTAGDANQDGYEDVLIGVPFTGAGKVCLVYGGTSMGWTSGKNFTGSNDGDRFGFAVAGGKNLDGSTQPDLVVGAPMSSSEKGAVHVILNPAKATPKEVTLTGAAIKDWFGRSVAVLDYNNDLFGDVAVGAPCNPDASDVGIGKAYLYYGAGVAGKFDRVADVTFSVGQTGDMFGASVAAGDPRTDGITDLIVGAPLNDTAGINAGRAYVFYGNETADSEPDVVVEGFEAESWFGICVASGGVDTADYDDDLTADFAVGAPYNGTANNGATYLYNGILVVMPDNPEVYGYVLDSDEFYGLGNALVTMESPVYSAAPVRTTSNGSYGPISLPPGTYWVNASYDDYFTEAKQYTLALGDEENVTFLMDSLPIVQGYIFDGNTTVPAANPLEGALVEVYDSSDTLLADHTTDDTGNYYFMLEVEDDIEICVTKENYFDGSAELTVEGNYDETTNFTLNHYPILSVTTEDTEGDEIVGARISVSIGGEEVVTGETDISGSATLMVPGAGDAYVNASRAGYVSNSTMVTLEQNTTESVSFVMFEQPSIAGTINDDMFETPISGAKIDLSVSGSTDILLSVTSDTNGAYSFEVVYAGIYDIRVTANGYFRQTRPVTVVADESLTEDFWLVSDTTPPTSEISDPQPGLEYTTPDVTVYANATDPNGNDILAVALYYSHEGKPYKLWGAADTVAPYVFEFDASSANGDGIYEFYTLASDCAGNQEPIPTMNYTWIIMDSNLPVSEVDNLDPYQGADTFTVTATGSDPDGVKCIELWYSYDGGAFELYGLNDTDTTYSWEFTATDGDGEYAFYSILVNGIDQRELPPDESDTSTLLDTANPTATISSPEEDADLDSGTVELEADVADDGAGLDYVSYQVDSEDEVVVEIDDGQAEYGLAATLDLEDGEHTVIVTATDILGWQSSDDVTFRVDTAPPELTILHPVDGSAVNTVDVEVSWSVEDEVSGVESTEVRMDSGSWETAVGTSKLYENLADDVYTVDVRVIDFAGNPVTRTTTFEVDTIAPTVYITDPEEDEVLTASTVVVKWQQSDIGSGLDKVEIRIDGGDWELTVTNVTEFTSLSDGSYTVDVMATDMAGNTDMDTVTFEVSDTTAPAISISSPEDGEILAVDSVTAEWTVTDAGTGVSSVEYKLDSAAWVPTTATGSEEFTGLAEGTHTFSVRAEDNADNIAVIPVQFVVDTMDPTIVITAPTDSEVLASEDVTVEYTADGTGTDIASVERSVDGGAWEPAGASSTLVESLDGGLHTVDIRVTDEAGHQATASVEFTVDLGAPVVTITSPADDALFSTDSVTVEWTVSDLDATVEEVRLDDDSWQEVTGGSATFSDLSDGEHTVEVRAIDEGSNEGQDSVTFTVDTTPPTVSITTPAEDAVMGSSSVVVTWAATDAVTTERSVDGGAWQAVTGTSVTISPLTDGEHSISIRVTDVAGHQAVDSVTILVDTTAPTVEITSPSEGATVGAEVTVEWTADDGLGSGVDTVEVSIDGGAWTAATGSSHTFTGLTPGQHTVDVSVTDDAGNEGTDSVTFTVTAAIVDTTAPTVSITSPTNGSSLPSSSVTVTWVASDGTGSGIDTVEVKLDGGAWTVVTTSSRSFIGLSDGSHTVSVRVTDNASNSATIGVNFMVDTVDPMLTITSPEDGIDTRDTAVTITWTCSDTGCGIDRIEVCIDGGSYISVGTASERAFTDLAVGDHTVDVRAYDEAGNMVEASVDFTVSEGGGISALLIGGIVLAIIVVAAVAVMLVRRKKAPAPPPE